MRKHLKWNSLLGYLVLFGLVVGVQHILHHGVLAKTKVWEGACTKVKFLDKDPGVRLTLKCDDRDAYTDQDEIVAAMAESPTSLQCDVFHFGEARCKIPEKD